jgi:transposase-like protein
MRGEVAADIRSIFNAPDLDEANHLLEKLFKKYEKKAPRLANWPEENLTEGFTVFSLPSSHRRRLRTTNLIERLNQEIRRRTRVARLFPNKAVGVELIEQVEYGRVASRDVRRAALVPLPAPPLEAGEHRL